MGLFGSNSKIQDKILEDLRLIERRLDKLEVDVEGIVLRLRKKVYREPDIKTETSKYNDGFDELRDLKNG